jgi:hypothetical protein
LPPAGEVLLDAIARCQAVRISTGSTMLRRLCHSLFRDT